MSSPPTILVTGASGFLGGLVAAALLVEEGRRLVLPIRATTPPADCLARIRLALRDLGVSDQNADDLLRLITVVELPSPDRLGDLDAVVAAAGVDEIVHCAGCVDYFDKRRLQLVNVELTSRFLEAARRWQLRRFVYVSTAYCSGYRTGSVPETLHPEPAPTHEPTDYTRSKRVAEWRVADSGVPFLIIRPSIVVGDSRTGKYTGKNYGLYQMWRAIEGLLCREYSPVWYTVAPLAALNLVHQDAFQAAFVGMYRSAPPGTIAHLVSDHAMSPTLRDLCLLWADIYRPVEVHAYAHIDDVPLRSLPSRQRRFLELAAKNLEIATHPWVFETGVMDGLRAAGLVFADATLETITHCQARYVEGSSMIRQYTGQYGGRSSERPRVVEIPGPPHPLPT